MRTLGIFFYTSVLVFIGITLLAFTVALSFRQLEPHAIKYINDFLNYFQGSINARLIAGISGVLLIFISFSLAQLILARFQREKNIAFTTPSGQVTIALAAIEDLIARLAAMIPEIRELKPNVEANKKGNIIVDIRAVLRTEANIPELTSRLQEITRSKIQEVVGLDEQIIIRIHIAKIMPGEEKQGKYKETDKPTKAIPFGGYGKI